MVCCASKVMQSESANKNIDRQEHRKALTQQYNYKTKRTKIYFSCPTHDHKHPTRLGAYGSNACRHNRRPTPQPSSPQLLCTSAAPPTHPDLAPTHTHAATPASSHPPDKLEDLQPRVPGTLTPRSGRAPQHRPQLQCVREMAIAIIRRGFLSHRRESNHHECLRNKQRLLSYKTPALHTPPGRI